MKEPKNIILVEIFTTDNLLDTDLRKSFDEQVSPFCEATLTEKEDTPQEIASGSANGSASIAFRLEYVVSPITTSTISSWLTTQIQERAEKLCIDRQELPILEEEIKDAIEEITVKREIIGKRSLLKER